MALLWKITVVAGLEKGASFSFPAEQAVVIGRSHTAQLRVAEPDVSGRHVELSVKGGVPVLVNFSRFPALFNGNEVATGEAAVIGVGDVLRLGAELSLRFDSIPVASAEPVAAESETPAAQSDEADAVTMVGASVEKDDSDLPTNAFPSPAPAPAPAPVASSSSPSRFPSQSPSPAADDGNETIALETRVGSAEEIQAMRRMLDRKRKGRRGFWVVGLLFFAVGLGALWWQTRSNKEVHTMEFPTDASGRQDQRNYVVRDDDGRALFEIDYPNNVKLDAQELPDGKGLTVMSWMGRERDVPFYLSFTSFTRAEELSLGLMDSVNAWFTRMEGTDGGFVFDEHMRTALEPLFLEDEYPNSCQETTDYGVRFLRFEYKRTWPNGKLWHGMALYFRRGDTVYVHRREIPEFYWERGRNRILRDPNLGVYRNYSETYWESRGNAGLPLKKPALELMAEVRASLAKERAGEWSYVQKNLDSLFVQNWRSDVKTRDLAMGGLRQLREMQRTYYYGKYNAFRNAKDNQQDKKAASFRQDVKIVFTDPSTRYYKLVNNGEIW